MSIATALVIGGTGPTGYHIVRGLIERGFEVAILHTGRHEIDEIPPQVEHIHTDPFSESDLRAALGQRTFDVTVATYGRLRRVAQVMAGRTGRFISVGGGPAYLGYMNAEVLEPAGLPVPVAEDAELVTREEQDAKGYRIARTETALFEAQPDATHFRYPYIYGKYQIAPREWSVVRRILDGREFIILPDGGLTLNHCGFAQNMAHALLLAVDNFAVSRGQVYNCGDDEVLTLHQVVEIITKALAHDWIIESLPWEFAAPARPLVQQPWTTHRVFDTSKLKRDLGYRDLVAPREALTEVARQLAGRPLAYGGTAEKVLQDPFDYAAEDAIIAAWRQLRAAMPAPSFRGPPAGYGTSYSGPGGKPRSHEFD
jgi:nucleoside-diphosphate-sugar epimerase